jgi:uncharacterized protein with GYD domain
VNTYLMLSKLTPEGLRSLHKNPEHLQEVNRDMERMGCRVVSQHALLGEYDFFTVFEAPDNDTAAHVSVDLGTRGTMSITTHATVSVDDLVARLHGGAHIAKT